MCLFPLKNLAHKGLTECVSCLQAKIQALQQKLEIYKRQEQQQQQQQHRMMSK